MKATIVSYTLEKLNPRQRIALHRVLYGYNDQSNNGSYSYERAGLIHKKGILKLNRGVIIVTNIHKKEVLSVLKKNKATVKTLNADINKSMLH
jgi:alkylated DNA nucleotide flippase Atl1